MELIQPVKEHSVTDLDFLFISGYKYSSTIDKDAGDSYEELDDRFMLKTVAKPSLTDPGEMSNPEQVEVFKSGLAFVAKRQRKQRMPSVDEAVDMRNTVKRLASLAQ